MTCDGCGQEERVGLGKWENGRAPNLCLPGLTIRQVLDAAIAAHGQTGSEEPAKPAGGEE